MDNLAKLLTSLAALAFLLAVVTNFTGPLLNTLPEGFSRACTNLALLAIAFAISFGDRRPGVVGSGTPR
jgi:fucose permease